MAATYHVSRVSVPLQTTKPRPSSQNETINFSDFRRDVGAVFVGPDRSFKAERCKLIRVSAVVREEKLLKTLEATEEEGIINGGSFLSTVKETLSEVSHNWKEMFRMNYWAVHDFQRLVNQVNGLETQMQSLSDSQLKDKTAEFRARLAEGETLDDIQSEAFAVVREAAKRSIGMRHFDVQIIGGAVLHSGAVAEMQTGEGKTLVATLAAYLNALPGGGVHIITVNDYLARRDAQWMGKVHRFLGLTVGLIQEDMGLEARQEAYSCDITYANNSALGFDYLKDHLVNSREDQVLKWPRPLNFAIIDEIDSVIIDDGRVPLIISQQMQGVFDPIKCKIVASVIEKLKRNNLYEVLYTVDRMKKDISLTNLGAEVAWKDLLACGWPKSDGVDDIWAAKASLYLKNGLFAEELLVEGQDYFVLDGEVKLIDQLSGRLSDRSWSGGLHQAVEAKENRNRFREQPLELSPVNQEAARTTWKQLARLYAKLAGMTGTAISEKEEFMTALGMPVVQVPTNKPRRRIDMEPVLYDTKVKKWQVVASRTYELTCQGRPVLIGTSSVNDSEELSKYLDILGVKYHILNARPEYAVREAAIIAQAGRASAVTIATNMAGRGTDILLGGNPEMLAKEILTEHLRNNAPGEYNFDSLSTSIKFSPKTLGAIARCKALWTLSGQSPDTPACQEMLQSALDTILQFTPLEFDNLERLALARDRDLSKWDREVMQRALGSEKVYRSFALHAQAHIVVTLEYMLRECRPLCREERDLVVKQGGLHVIATEVQESMRLDDQLRGRAGRQGDPGSTETILSTEDRMFQEVIFGFAPFSSDGLPFPQLRSLQKIWTSKLAEELHSAQKYDEVLESQRNHVYSLRQHILEASHRQVDHLLSMFLETLVHDMVHRHFKPNQPFLEETMDQLLDGVLGILPRQHSLHSQQQQDGSHGPAFLHYLSPGNLAMAAKGVFPDSLNLHPLPSTYLQQPAHSKWSFLNRVDSDSQECSSLKTFLFNVLLHHQKNIFSTFSNVEQFNAKRAIVISQLDLKWHYQLRLSQRLWEASFLRGLGDLNPEEEFKIDVSRAFLTMLKSMVKSTVKEVLNPKHGLYRVPSSRRRS